jgi:diguanylate cyclase (GGDEF)-like protein
MQKLYQGADVFPEIILIADTNGAILELNTAGQREFKSLGVDGHISLASVSTNPKQLLDYLHLCSRTKTFLPGKIKIHLPGKEPISYRLYGALFATRTEDYPARIILRMVNAVTTSNFTALNRQIADLSKEIQRRRKAEAELEYKNHELMQLSAELIKQRDVAKANEERLQFVMDSAQIGEWDLDLLNDTAYRSLRHDQCFGYFEPIPEWGFEKFIQHVHPQDRAWVKQVFEKAIQNIESWHLECRVIWPDGSEHWIAAHGSVYEVEGKPGRMAGIVLDITKRKQAEEKVRHAALHDPLTNLPNRSMLFEYAEHLLPLNRRTRRKAAVLFMDLDRFKPINDMHGHEVGDMVLTHIARRLATCLRAEDIVTRLGGDEFVILVQDISDATYAAEVTRHILDKLNEPYLIGELTLSLSASIGISIFPTDGDNIDALISHADAAMYQAKQQGRNNFQFYSPALDDGRYLQLAIEQQLKAALHRSTFHLCYQPVIDLKTGAVVSVEALLRWQNADIGPECFVPIAEATGIINPIGRWVLQEASRQHKTWIENGLPSIPIAVNVSAVEFRDKDFVSRFVQLMSEYGIAADALQLELTETAVMDDIDHAVSVLTRLKTMGVKILLDDFGTGHSSLSHLANLPLNKIKIDKTFISRLEHDVASRAVTDAMLALGNTLNLDVIAEGIESRALLDYVQALGCQQAQGYFVSKPMDGKSFESWYFTHICEIKEFQPAESLSSNSC